MQENPQEIHEKSEPRKSQSSQKASKIPKGASIENLNPQKVNASKSVSSLFTSVSKTSGAKKLSVGEPPAVKNNEKPTAAGSRRASVATTSLINSKPGASTKSVNSSRNRKSMGSGNRWKNAVFFVVFNFDLVHDITVVLILCTCAMLYITI